MPCMNPCRHVCLLRSKHKCTSLVSGGSPHDAMHKGTVSRVGDYSEGDAFKHQSSVLVGQGS